MDTFVAYDEPQSIFSEALGMIVEEETQFIALVENNILVTEGSFTDFVRNLNIKKIFTFIFEKFVALIKKILSNISNKYRVNNMADDELINEYKYKVRNIKEPIDCSECGTVYDYNFGQGGAGMEFRLEMMINSEMDNIARTFDEINISSKTSTEFQSKILVLSQAVKDQYDDFLDIARQKCLGVRYKVSKDDFLRELENYFQPEVIGNNGILSPNDINNISRLYTSRNKIEKEWAQKTLKEVNSLKNRAMIRLDSFELKIIGPRSDYNVQIKNAFSDLMRCYTNEVQGMCNIFASVVSYKLDLINKQYSQLHKVLVYIIRKAVKEGLIK